MNKSEKRIHRTSLGDVFAVPLPAGGYGFGRIIYLKEKWRLAEFFEYFSGSAVYNEDMLNAGNVMPVHNIVTLPIENRQWAVVNNVADDLDSKLSGLEFYKGLLGDRVAVTLDGAARPVSDAECVGLSSSMPQFPPYIAKILEENLREKGAAE